MKRIAIIDDDPKIGNVYRTKFATEGFQVDYAGDGRAGLELISAHRPDVVLLDLMLPGMSGIEVLKAVRADDHLAEIPVIVFSNAHAADLSQQAAAAGVTKILAKAMNTPKRVVEVVNQTLIEGHTQTVAAPPAEVSDDEFQSELRQACLESAATEMEALRRDLQTLAKDGGHGTGLAELYRRVHSLAGNTGLAGLTTVSQLAGALEALLKELKDKPDRVTPSSVRTVAQAVDGLGALFQVAGNPHGAVTVGAKVLVVDDEEIARKAVMHSITKAGMTAVPAGEPVSALKLAAEQTFDMIVSDVEMPGMTGMEMVTKLRALPQYGKTPIVFVTTLSGFEHRAQAVLSGGNDLIAKPFLFSELSLKALTLVLKCREAAKR
jgi:CheY-like chemotaxis protein